jgi:multiple sugar transport system permease protein
MTKSKYYLIRRTLLSIPVMLFLVILSLLMLTPIVWMIVSSFKPDPQIIRYPPTFFPALSRLTLKNYANVQRRIQIFLYVRNSVIYALGVTLPAMAVNSLAGYSFARYKFPGRNIIFVLLLATMMVPFQVIMVPTFLIIHAIGWYNTFAGLLIPRFAGVYWIFLLRAAFSSLPKELEEAARIDGLSEFGIYSRIMLPQIWPTMVTMFILCVNGNWNDLIWPLIMTATTSMRTLANGLAMFVGSNTIEYGAAFAGATISLVPMLLMYIFGQRYFVEGQITSGIKG